MPGDAMEPDESQTLAGKQHRQQLVKDLGPSPGQCRGAHRFCDAMDLLFDKANIWSIDEAINVVYQSYRLSEMLVFGCEKTKKSPLGTGLWVSVDFL